MEERVWRPAIEKEYHVRLGGCDVVDWRRRELKWKKGLGERRERDVYKKRDIYAGRVEENVLKREHAKILTLLASRDGRDSRREWNEGEVQRERECFHSDVDPRARERERE
jgi:hypothetical protein